MRPAGEVRQALFAALRGLAQQGAGATLVEVAAAAQVGRRDASMCLKNMRRAGVISIVGVRRVSYRNRPVAEYAPVQVPIDAAQPAQAAGWGCAELGGCMAAWAR